MKMIIGISGGIGSGKSVVSRILRLSGFPVYDCDYRASLLMNMEPILSRLRERYGPGIVNNDGKLNRQELAAIIFYDEAERLWVNDCVHSSVRSDVLQWSSREICFVESAIMAESGLTALCSEIWLVDAPEDVRIRRAVARKLAALSDSRLSVDAVRTDVVRRVEAQRAELKAVRRCACPLHIIDNSGSCPILPQIRSILLRK